MALGMTKDSMLDLQSLAEEKETESSSSIGGKAEDTVNLLMTGMSRDSIMSYQKLPEVDLKRDPIDDHPIVDLQVPTKPKEGDSSTALSSPVSSGPQVSDQEEDYGHYGEEEKKQDPLAAGPYLGFANDYDTYNYDAYQHFQYHQDPQSILGGPRQQQGGLLCCLFPWFFNGNNSKLGNGDEANGDDGSGPGQDFEQHAKAGRRNPLRRASSSGGSDDDVSTASAGSEGLGERLSDKDRQAVLARLRLAQPDKKGAPNSPDQSSASGSGENHDSTPDTPGKDKVLNNKSLLNELPNLPMNDQSNDSQNTAPKGILKRQNTIIKSAEPQKGGENKKRRSLFPSYDTNGAKKNDNHVQFAPMARVVTVKSQKDMTEEEKSAIWWQRWDYEDFRKTGRIITRAMLEGGSEIWLASNESWQHNGMSKSSTLKNAISLSDRAAKNGEKNESSDEENSDVIQTTGDKWWHRFGHSRRGLEHIASIKEGSERQANVRHAIKAVLDEQKRQRAYMREEPEKLRMVSLHNTSWARDLALAAGSSDADAVKSNFVEDRKSREFYLLKMARSNSTTSRGKHVPAFMQPAMNTIAQQQLDANTSGQLKFRQKEKLQQRRESRGSDSSSKKDKPPTPAKKSLEPIHDPEPSSDSGKDLAKRAAGFSHDGAEEVNMAAVLSGMGAVPKKAQAVGAH